jgi:hypothetical protein
MNPASVASGQDLDIPDLRHMLGSPGGVGTVPKSRHGRSTKEDHGVVSERGKHCPPSSQTVGRVQRVEVLSAEVERKEKCWGCQRPVITFTNENLKLETVPIFQNHFGALILLSLLFSFCF